MRASQDSTYSTEVNWARAYAYNMNRMCRLARHIGIVNGVSITGSGVDYRVKSLEEFRAVSRQLHRKFPGYRLELVYAYAHGTEGSIEYRLKRDGSPIPVSVKFSSSIDDMPTRLLVGKCAFRKKTKLVPAQEKEFYAYTCEEG